MIHYTDVQTFGDPDDTFPYRSDWLRKMGLVAESCCVAELEDPAMKVNGQLLVDTLQNKLLMRNNKHHALYLLQTAHGPIVRRVHVNKGGTVTLKADHAEPQTVPQDSLVVVGRVVIMTNFVGA